MGDAIGGCGFRCHCNLDRITQHLRGEFRDGTRHGCGKHQGLPPNWDLRNDLTNVADKTHVEHAVGLVEHQAFDAVETYCIAFDEIEQAARRGDKDIDTAEQ